MGFRLFRPGQGFGVSGLGGLQGVLGLRFSGGSGLGSAGWVLGFWVKGNRVEVRVANYLCTTIPSRLQALGLP